MEITSKNLEMIDKACSQACFLFRLGCLGTANNAQTEIIALFDEYKRIKEGK